MNPKTQSDLDKLPRKSMSKSMRNIEDILADVANGVELPKDEERLVDRITFEKTGKRFGSFKVQKKPKKKLDVVIATEGKGQLEPVAKNTRTRKDPKVVSGVSVNGAIS